jgi:hypothetical protein
VRNYEIIPARAEEGAQPGLPLTATRTDPIVYAHVGVSAADDKTYTDDDQKWAGPWSNRFGNEGGLDHRPRSSACCVKMPGARVTANAGAAVRTRADQNGSSFYTFRWQPLAQTMTHVYRAFDEAVFKTDWSHRPGATLAPSRSNSSQANRSIRVGPVRSASR